MSLCSCVNRDFKKLGSEMRLLLAVLLFIFNFMQPILATGQFELQIVEIQNRLSQLRTGECCDGSTTDSSPGNTCAQECNTVVALCLKEFQSGVHSRFGSDMRSTNNGSPPTGGDCTYGRNVSQVLGSSSFTVANPPLHGHLHLPIKFSWTRSFTLVLEILHQDIKSNSSTYKMIDWTSYSGILLPGLAWHSPPPYTGPVAKVTYKLRVICDKNYYDANCTKFCRARDDLFGHHTCDDAGNKVCLPGWAGSNCDEAKCKEGCHLENGKCTQPGECNCRPGWTGEFCDECKPHPGCKHGFCNGRPYTCECELNWGGILCDQDLNYCGRYPCQNGGTCENTAPDRYNCTCAEGFSGENCEVVENPCAVGPCRNGGTCMEVDGGFQCTCTPGWEGDTCLKNIDECAPGPCHNEGVCEDLVNGYLCSCKDGWTGLTCQEDINECQNDPCVNSLSCKNLNGTFECQCQRGWNGQRCELNINECHGQCQNGGTCLDLVNDYHCACDVGFSGRNCETNVDDCSDTACLNGGECVDMVDGYRCICPVGYSGRQCEIDIDQCNPNPCKNGGLCMNTQTDYFCHCPERWRGKNCTLSKQPCLSASCQIDSCTVPMTHPDGQLIFKPSGVCGERGRCVSLFDGAFACVCDPGYTGKYCHINIDECESNPCQNGATCVDLIDGFQCVCDLGWEGHLCNKEINECLGEPCQNNGTCRDGVADFECQCGGGWKGRRCSSLHGHCDHNPCQNGGTCADLGSSFVCQCQDAFEGSVCHIAKHKPCDDSPCKNSGTCVNTDQGPNCICKDGFQGHFCESNIDDCAKRPCHNGGTCIDGINWRMCQCPAGYTGPDCRNKFEHCSSQPCAFGSKCVEEFNGFRCICPEGRFGNLCEKTESFSLPLTRSASPRWCQWAGDMKAHGTVWRHHCNTCHCNLGTVTCSTVWCGPQNCLESLDNKYPCHPRQVCVPDSQDLCLSPPCQAFGQCRDMSKGHILPTSHQGSQDCQPNHAQLSNSCARLTLILDPNNIPVGTHVHAVCEGLRAAWADRYAHVPAPPPIILCGLAYQQNYTIEVTLSYDQSQEPEDVEQTARQLSELVRRKLTPVTALTSVIEVRVHTFLLNDPPATDNVANGILTTVALLLLIAILATVVLLAVWQCRRKHKLNTNGTLSRRLHHSKMLDEAQIEKTNNENEEKLRRYRNPLKDSNLSSNSHSSSQAICEAVEPPTISKIHNIEDRSISRLNIGSISCLSEGGITTDGDYSCYQQHLPYSMRKVQNTDVERNTTPENDSLINKELQKSLNLRSSPISHMALDNVLITDEIVV